jgi:hypothetical protein
MKIYDVIQAKSLKLLIEKLKKNEAKQRSNLLNAKA